VSDKGSFGFHFPEAKNLPLLSARALYLRRLPNNESHLAILNSHLRKHGFDFDLAKEGIEQMLRNGYLYSPREDYVKLVQKYE
jgi:hypothetical protein